MIRLMKFAAVLALGAIVPAVSSAVADDRGPSPEERAAIEAKLTSAGYSSWEEIELDDGKWEVDDAKYSDGKTYDLELGRQSLEIVSKKTDG